MNKNKTYYIGSGNFFGKCEASDKFHKEMYVTIVINIKN